MKTVALGLALLFALSACGGGGDASPEFNPQPVNCTTPTAGDQDVIPLGCPPK